MPLNCYHIEMIRAECFTQCVAYHRNSGNAVPQDHRGTGSVTLGQRWLPTQVVPGLYAGRCKGESLVKKVGKVSQQS